MYTFSAQPCGEYLFDFRNGSMLQDWIVDELIAGPTGVGAKEVDGLFIDDYWCSDLICKADSTVAGCPCNDTVQGPTEINKYSQSDIGLSDEDVRAITLGWNDTMGKVQQKILDMNAYTWSLIKVPDLARPDPTRPSMANASTSFSLRRRDSLAIHRVNSGPCQNDGQG